MKPLPFFVSLFWATSIALSLLFATSTPVIAQSQNNNWTFVAENHVRQNLSTDAERQIVPIAYQTLSADFEALKNQLLTAPVEFDKSPNQNILLVQLPFPDGTFSTFQVVNSPVMQKGLAVKYPNIQTFTAKGIDDQTATAKLDFTQKGFHAMVRSARGTVFIDPYAKGNTTFYLSYFKADFDHSAKEMVCYVESKSNPLDNPTHAVKLGPYPIGDELRVYRLALAGTGEYTIFHGGTVEDVVASMATTMNRVNGVTETDVAVRMVIVEDNEKLIFTDPDTDPYSNGSAFAMLGENQSTTNDSIGNTNYDIGHVFGTNSGGVASLGSVCWGNQKARGVTGGGAPIGDPFDIDYVAHEMGHQFGGEHTFNACDEQDGIPYEPGSGSTIMAYAGLCNSNNLQPNSDPYYHVGSIEQIIEFSQYNGGNDCAEIIVINNAAPVINIVSPQEVYIPVATPFILEANATDGESNSVLTYCWEQYDLGPSAPVDEPIGNAPIFRSFNPTTDNFRIFPVMSDIVNGFQTIGEVLPTYSRNLGFRITVRDNNPGCGGVDWEDYSLSVTDDAGPFEVTSPNEFTTTWTAGDVQTVTWDIAGTDLAPINCQEVHILLSLDGGYTYNDTLAMNVPNTGSTSVFVPDWGNLARIMVRAADNVFFDISDQDFTILPPSAPDFFVVPQSNTTLNLCAPETAMYELTLSTLLDFNEPITLSLEGAPEGATVEFSETMIDPTTTDGFSIMI
ncbi:MAG: reprolysin-like metallopeptidase, partial [Chitinophagales bacterium]